MKIDPSYRRAALAIMLVTGLSGLLAPGRPDATSAEYKPAHRIVIDGPISPAVTDFIETSIEHASDAGASALIVQLDTPGGLLDSTKDIVKNILAAPLPVIIYVAPGGASATSAGVFITLAGHVAAMAPGTTIGAAHPVGGQGQDIEGDMREKVENFAVSFVESIAERRGRNVEWAEKAVRESVSITETEAVDLDVVDFVAADLDELLNKANGLEAEVAGVKAKLDLSAAITSSGQALVTDVEMTFRQRVLNVITDPNIAYLLMMAGMLGLYMEFSNPGAIFPGVAGAICLLLALLASQVLPISSTGVLLIMVGMAFLIGELLMPSFGVLGIGGIVALTLGSLFLYTPESQLEVDRSIISATIIFFSSAIVIVLGFLVRDRRRRAVTGADGLIDEIGVTVTPVHGSGKVKVHGEFWNASSDEALESDVRVRVVGVQGLRIKVSREQE